MINKNNNWHMNLTLSGVFCTTTVSSESMSIGILVHCVETTGVTGLDVAGDVESVNL